MFCVIQKVINKKPNPYGAHKELIVDSHRSNLYGISRTKFTHRYSSERFERPIRDAYKIMIHQSYRESGRVKKRQWVICTMGYYTMLEFWVGDCINSKRLMVKLKEMGINEKQLWEMVYQRLDPIVATVKAEFEQSEEFRTKQNHDHILNTYKLKKSLFEKKYGQDTYDFCYDVFGELRKPKLLQELINTFEERQEWNRRSEDERRSKGESGASDNNYDYSKYSSYFATAKSTYSDEEKAMLKTIYRALSKSFHPDITQDDGQIMKLINRLKEGWGI